jgi:3-oxoacyl-[acyl-carrier protein] reductase
MTARHVALVTGAGRGIGLATSRALLAAGHHVVVVDRNGIDPEALFSREHLSHVTAVNVDGY